ncbi:hypothetical protein [Spirillospora sp. NPDC047279]|uniref:hypothetical protein n=1 Tax=Spirillospora sp. NPDC047279 TaxID=3155478 RepID=UPI0033D30090
MRRFTPFVPLLLLALPLTGCAASVEDQTADDAGDKARRVNNVLYGFRGRTPQDFGHRAADLDDVDTMKVGGATGKPRVVIRVPGKGTEGGGLLVPGEEVTHLHCFELRFPTEWDREPERVTCPGTAPLTFAPWPETPDIPAGRLRRALPKVPGGGTANEAAVRAAVTSLKLDPAVIVEIKSEGGVVGVSLAARPYLEGPLDCTLVRVAPGRTSIWTPSRMQRMPGEGGCSAFSAIHPQPPPH